MSDGVFGWMLVLMPVLVALTCLYFGIQLLRPSRSTDDTWASRRAIGILMLSLSFLFSCLAGLALLLTMALNWCADLGKFPEQPR